MSTVSSLLDEYEDDEVVYVLSPVVSTEEGGGNAASSRPGTTASTSYTFHREWADAVSLQLPENSLLSQAINELVAQGHGVANHTCCAHYTTMVADDDGDPDDDMPEIGADSNLKTLNVKAFHVSIKEGADLAAEEAAPAAAAAAVERVPALPTVLPPGVVGHLHTLHLSWHENPLAVALEAGASVTDLVRALVQGQCALPRRTRSTSYIVSIADEEGLPDDDLPALSHNSHLKDFMGYGDGFHLAPHGEEDPEGTIVEGDVCEEAEDSQHAVANTYRLVVPWEVPSGALSNETEQGPQGWGITSNGPNLTTHATPGETVASMVARVAVGERGHTRGKYRLQLLESGGGAGEPTVYPGDLDVGSLDPSASYVLVEDGNVCLDSRSCLDTAWIQLPWLVRSSCSKDMETASPMEGGDRFVWRGREERATAPASGHESCRVQAVRACPDTRVKALVDAIATFHLLPPHKCGLTRSGGCWALPMEAPLYSLGIPELVFDFLVDRDTWRESVNAIIEQEKAELAATPSSSAMLGSRLDSMHLGALRSDSMANLLLLSDSSVTMDVQEEYRVRLGGAGRQAGSQCTLLIDAKQITTQKVPGTDKDNPWYQFAASIETADTQPLSNVRSVSVQGAPEEARFDIVFRPDRAVSYTVVANEAKVAMQKRDDIVLKLLKLLQAEHGGQNMEWQCMMRSRSRGGGRSQQPRIVGVDRHNFYNYEPVKKGLRQMLGFASGPKRDFRKLLHLKSIDLHPSLTTVFTVVFNEGSELQTSEDISTVYEASSAEECESIVAHIRKLADVARAQHEIDARGRIRSGSRRASV